MRSKKARGLLFGSFLLVCLMQTVHPNYTSQPHDRSQSIQSDPGVPASVKAIVQRACYDCHSYETSWPWYSRIAPASWLTHWHVTQGREHLNFSNWMMPRKGSETAVHTKNQLEEICDSVNDGSMPLRSYVWIHPAAKLKPPEIAALCAWPDREGENISARNAEHR